MKYATQQILSAFCARVTAQRRLNGAADPTSNVDLITPEVVRGLGVDQHTLSAGMVRGIGEAAEVGIDEGRLSAAVEFVEIAQPFADPDSLRDIATKLNYKAAQAPGSSEEQSRYRRMLLDASASIYREVFGVAAAAQLAAPDWHSSSEPSMIQSGLRKIVHRNQYDTDKSAEYLRNYERAFAHLRTRQIALMEIGVNRGGSLHMWRDYFRRGTIVGVDLAPPADFVDPSGRCRLFRGDQTDPQGLSAIAASAAPVGFNIIIDDASHIAEATAATFKTLFYDHLQPGGFYAIEDWGTV